MKFRRLNPFYKSKNKHKKKQKPDEDTEARAGATDTGSHHDRRCPFVCNGQTVQERGEKGNIDFDIKSQYRLHLEDITTEAFGQHGHCTQCRHDNLEVDCGTCFSDKGSDYDTDGNSNTLKRSRTRIKTNPWLPSPRLSPASFKSTEFKENDNNTSDSDNCEPLSESSKVCAAITRHFRPDNSDHSMIVLNNDVVTCNDSSRPQGRELGLCVGQNDQENNYRWSIISEGDISVDFNLSTVDDMGEKFSNLEHPVDFDYENNVDEILESDSKGDNRLSIIDLLDDNTTCDSTTSLESSISSSDGNMTSSAEFARSRESSIMTDSDLSESSPFFFPQTPESIDEEDSFYLPTTFQGRVVNMDDSIDAGYSSLSRDGRMTVSEYSDSEGALTAKPPESACSLDNDGSAVLRAKADTIRPTQKEEDISYAAFEEDLFLDFLEQPTGRTFSEVKMSLEEKVNQLRLEKLVLEQKIQEAQAAEVTEIPSPEYRRQRSDFLADQLTGLKCLLEEQTDRLQKNYYKILSLHRRHRRHRQPYVFSEPQPNGR